MKFTCLFISKFSFVMLFLNAEFFKYWQTFIVPEIFFFEFHLKLGSEYDIFIKILSFDKNQHLRAAKMYFWTYVILSKIANFIEPFFNISNHQKMALKLLGLKVSPLFEKWKFAFFVNKGNFDVCTIGSYNIFLHLLCNKRSSQL